MRLDCGCDTLSGHKCQLHEWPWIEMTCPDCGYEKALRNKYNRSRTYCEGCGRRT